MRMISGLAIAACLLVPGLGWLWCRPAESTDKNGFVARGIISFSIGLTLGLLINLLVAWFLLEIGQFNLYTLTGGIFALSGAGFFIGYLRSRSWVSLTPKAIWPAVGAFSALCVLILAFPPRGEWIAGGWDPGVYMNQGLYAAQQGGWRVTPMPAHADLIHADYNPFIRAIAGRDELFPGIPFDADSGALRLTFYPITPAWIAWLYTISGPHAALHAMLLLALILCFLLLGGLFRAGASPAFAILGTALIALHPLLIYHARTPCSEMMEMVFVAMLLIALSRSDSRSIPALLSLVLLAGILNRPTFLIWSALLFPLLAVRRDLKPATCLVLALPVVAGIAYYSTIGSAGVDRIGHLFPRLTWAAVAVIPLSYALAALLTRRSWSYTAPLLFTFTPLLVLSAVAVFHPDPLTELNNNVRKLAPYLGYPLILLGALGFASRLVSVWQSRRMTPLDAWLWLCICVAVVPFVFKFAADLYPWATKRFLSGTLPILGCGAACALMLPRERARNGKKVWTWISVAAGLTVILWGHGDRLRDAWNTTEYDGLFHALQAVSAKLDKDDLVLTDHFLWGTPLAMVFQHQTLNGERLWARESGRRTSAALDFLRNQQAGGRRVLVLTSTERGMAVFPDAFQDAQRIQDFPPYTYRTIAHHRNGTGFPARERTTMFRLYLLKEDP